MASWTDYNFNFGIICEPFGDRIAPVNPNSFMHYLPPIPQSRESIKQHKDYVGTLEKYKIKTLSINNLLSEVLERDREIIYELLTVKQINLLRELGIDIKDITADMIINGYPQNPKEFLIKDHIIEPNPAIYWTRDSTIHIPLGNNLNGVIICHMKNFKRKQEPKIMKSIYRYNKRFKDLQIIGDFSNYSYSLEGGDVMVFDHNTLLVGLSERTNKLAFRTLTKFLEKNTEINEIAEIFLPRLDNATPHLDTLINLIQNNKNDVSVLIFPYIFDYPKIRDSKEILINVLKYCERIKDKRYGKLKEEIIKAGKAKIYKKMGKTFQLLSECSIIDYFKSKGVKNFITVGGTLGIDWKNPYEHALVAIKELSYLATNTLSVQPGVIIIFKGSPYTVKALNDNNFKCEIMESSELGKALGGPHCLIKPIG